jgi:hypothetical protein
VKVQACLHRVRSQKAPAHVNLPSGFNKSSTSAGINAASFCDISWGGQYNGRIVTAADSVDGKTNAVNNLNNNMVNHAVVLKQSGSCSESDGVTLLLRAKPASCTQTDGGKTSDCLQTVNQLPFSSYYLQIKLTPNKGASDQKLVQLPGVRANCSSDCRDAIQQTLQMFTKTLEGR